jgi:hypothetical protein
MSATQTAMTHLRPVTTDSLSLPRCARGSDTTGNDDEERESGGARRRARESRWRPEVVFAGKLQSTAYRGIGRGESMAAWDLMTRRLRKTEPYNVGTVIGSVWNN